MKKIQIATFTATTALAFGVTAAAHATDDPTPCVPKAAWTETVIDTPATDPTVVHNDAVTHEETVIDTPASDGFWTNFQPNHPHEPFVGPPSYPSDERGTWGEPKVNGGPQKDAVGVYASGNPAKGGNWFYREQPTEEVSHQETITDEEAYDETVPGTDAVTHTVDHPRVTCGRPTPTFTTTHVVPPTKQPTTTETINTPTKTVKIVREIKTGRVISKTVKHYDMTGVKEEGF